MIIRLSGISNDLFNLLSREEVCKVSQNVWNTLWFFSFFVPCRWCKVEMFIIIFFCYWFFLLIYFHKLAFYEIDFMWPLILDKLENMHTVIFKINRNMMKGKKTAKKHFHTFYKFFSSIKKWIHYKFMRMNIISSKKCI